MCSAVLCNCRNPGNKTTDDKGTAATRSTATGGRVWKQHRHMLQTALHPRGLLTSAGSCSAQLSALTRLMNFFLWLSGTQDPTISKGLTAIVSERESSSGAQKVDMRNFGSRVQSFGFPLRGSKSPTSVLFGPPKAFKDLGVWDASGLIIRYSCSAYC